MDSSVVIRFDRARNEFVVLHLEGRRAVSRIVIKRAAKRGVQIEQFLNSQGVDVDEMESEEGGEAEVNEPAPIPTKARVTRGSRIADVDLAQPIE